MTDEKPTRCTSRHWHSHDQCQFDAGHEGEHEATQVWGDPIPATPTPKED